MPGQEDRKPYKPGELQPDDPRLLAITERKRQLIKLVAYIRMIVEVRGEPLHETNGRDPVSVRKYKFMHFEFTILTNSELKETVLTIYYRGHTGEQIELVILSWKRAFSPGSCEVLKFSNDPQFGWLDAMDKVAELFERPSSFYEEDVEREMTRLGLK